MKINTLQILRAFAAIYVLITHVFQYSNYKPFGDYFLSGQYGVDIFFILSGFLIYLTVKKTDKPFQYAKKRLLRIYPLYIFVFLLYLITGTGKYHMEGVITYIQNITMMPWSKPIGYNSLIVVVAWTTVFELFFYFLFFLVIILKISKKWIIIIIPFIFTVSQFISKGEFVPVNAPFFSFLLSLGGSFYLFMFVIGCLISEFFITNKITLLKKKQYNILLIFSIIAMGVMMFVRYNFIMSFFVSSFLFLTISQFERYYKLNTKSMFIKKLIHWGDISFSIYILHIMIIKIIIEYLNFENTTILLLLTFVTTILLSSLTYKWIEKPFIDFSKKKKRSILPIK